MRIAYYALHYGSDYLGWSVKSIYDYVDKIYILYTNTPSHGHAGNASQNPDNKQKLQASLYMFGDPQNKIVWTEGKWAHEGQQRDSILSIASSINADTILTVDSDEIWRPETVTMAIETAEKGNTRNYCIRMLTFWRSFSWICTDDMLPQRVTCPKRPGGVTYLGDRVMHFGYARSVQNIAYKITCHGHLNEWRKDWFDRFKNWPNSGNNDLHPTCGNTWNAQPYDKNLLPNFLKSHPYFSLNVIP